MLGSGSLGLITFPGPARRLRRDEIDARYPALIDGLVSHPHIGFVLVASTARIARARPVRSAATWPRVRSSATTRSHRSAAGRVDQVRQVDAYATAADLMVNARYDPERDEVAAFESQVGSHGGLGGPQTHPFLLYPAEPR